MNESTTPKEILNKQIEKLKDLHYSNERSYHEFQNFVRELQQLAKSGTIGNLKMYGAMLDGCYSDLGDKRHIKSDKAFKEWQVKLIYELGTVTIF